MIPIGAILLTGAVASLAQMRRQVNVIDATVTDSYFSVETGEVKLLGVCDLLKPEVECWDTNGHLSAELNKQVLEELKTAATHNGIGQAEIPMVYREKNRIAVFDVPNPTGTKPAGIFSGIDTKDGYHPNPISFYWEPRLEHRIELVPIHTDRAETSTILFAQFAVPVSGSAFLEAKTGATAAVGSYTIAMGETLEVQPGTLPMFQPGPNWWAPIKSVSSGSMERVHVQLNAVDKKGALVASVDASGRPMKPAKPLTMPQYPFDPTGPRFVFTTVNSNFEDSLHGWRLQTNVNPKEVSGYNVTVLVDRTIRFTKVPLDPIR